MSEEEPELSIVVSRREIVNTINSMKPGCLLQIRNKGLARHFVTRTAKLTAVFVSYRRQSLDEEGLDQRGPMMKKGRDSWCELKGEVLIAKKVERPDAQ